MNTEEDIDASKALIQVPFVREYAHIGVGAREYPRNERAVSSFTDKKNCTCTKHTLIISCRKQMDCCKNCIIYFCVYAHFCVFQT